MTYIQDYNKNRRKYEWQVFTNNIVGEYAGSHDFEHLIEITKDGTRERTNFIRCGLTKCKVGNIESQLIELYVNKNSVLPCGTYVRKSGWQFCFKNVLD